MNSQPKNSDKLISIVRQPPWNSRHSLTEYQTACTACCHKCGLHTMYGLLKSEQSAHCSVLDFCAPGLACTALHPSSVSMHNVRPVIVIKRTIPHCCTACSKTEQFYLQQ
eukprot:Gb_39370 [translate_table: standard]